MPRVSVILPNYNYARYLKERVRTILHQTVSDFELIYIDDASKDASNEVMQTFADDPRVRMILHTQNSGRVYQRWSEGAELATGEWLWFAGADDAAHPQFLARLLALADVNPSAAIVHCNRLIIDSAGRIVQTYGDFPTKEFEEYMRHDYFAPGHEEIMRLCKNMFINTASGLLLRRDVYMQHGGWDNRLWLAADWDLYLSMLRTHDIAYTAEPLISYRSHTTSVSKSTRYVIKRTEMAYCPARIYNWMQDDPRFTPQMRATVLSYVRALNLEIFADPSATIPADLRFAAEEIYKVIPDKRLLRQQSPAPS